jgi:hypothetical protein
MTGVFHWRRTARGAMESADSYMRYYLFRMNTLGRWSEERGCAGGTRSAVVLKI